MRTALVVVLLLLVVAPRPTEARRKSGLIDGALHGVAIVAPKPKPARRKPTPTEEIPRTAKPTGKAVCDAIAGLLMVVVTGVLFRSSTAVADDFARTARARALGGVA